MLARGPCERASVPDGGSRVTPMAHRPVSSLRYGLTVLAELAVLLFVGAAFLLLCSVAS